MPETPTGNYIGRFAPSPTGRLHFGSLVSALASYLDARHCGGRWLVRMENLDPPREEAGAQDAILRALADHGLHWDGPVCYQGERLEAYAEALATLNRAGLIYRCRCRRKDVRAMPGGVYDGRCRRADVDPDEPHALRLQLYNLPEPFAQLPDTLRFDDLFQGPQHQCLRREVGDPIVVRKDGRFAYQLAVVVDDIAQGITHVVRGADLLEVTARQLRLFELMGAPRPAMGHVPMAINHRGQKLSKQTHAPALSSERAGANLWHALAFLEQAPPASLYDAGPDELLSWGCEHWQAARVRGETRLPELEEYLHE